MHSRTCGKRIIALISERGGGDAPPVVTLASALQARGHDISVLCDAGTETTVRAAGLEPIVVPDELEQGRHVDPRWLMQLHERGETLTAATPNPLTAWAQRCAPTIGPTVRQLEPALLLSSLFCTALANHLAKELGIPWCFVNPSFYFGEYGEQKWEDDFVGLGAGWFRYILLPHCDQANLVRRKLVLHGMGTVPQRGIGYSRRSHRTASCTLAICPAKVSPTCHAAAVMMSRFPAYAGR